MNIAQNVQQSFTRALATPCPQHGMLQNSFSTENDTVSKVDECLGYKYSQYHLRTKLSYRRAINLLTTKTAFLLFAHRLNIQKINKLDKLEIINFKSTVCSSEQNVHTKTSSRNQVLTCAFT